MEFETFLWHDGAENLIWTWTRGVHGQNWSDSDTYACIVRVPVPDKRKKTCWSGLPFFNFCRFFISITDTNLTRNINTDASILWRTDLLVQTCYVSKKDEERTIWNSKRRMRRERKKEKKNKKKKEEKKKTRKQQPVEEEGGEICWRYNGGTWRVFIDLKRV